MTWLLLGVIVILWYLGGRMAQIAIDDSAPAGAKKASVVVMIVWPVFVVWMLNSEDDR